MASVRREFSVDASPEVVWDALRDFGAVHERVARGFVLDATLEGRTRSVTFANGTTARELLVDLDDEARRIVYAVVGGRLEHHNASAQVFASGDGGSRLEWVTDLLPDEFADYVAGQMDAGVLAMQATLSKPVEG
ncbi:MAG: SRPBCC family protein [Dehalococcoidia bacterium]|nr:SRPBCC family protein [Dehalococcoidia bacterium]